MAAALVPSRVEMEEEARSRNAFQSLESRPSFRSDEWLRGDLELLLLRLSLAESWDDDERCREDLRELCFPLESMDSGLFGSP